MDRMFLRGLPRAFARRVPQPFLPRLHGDWRRILARAWSVRLWTLPWCSLEPETIFAPQEI